MSARDVGKYNCERVERSGIVGKAREWLKTYPGKIFSPAELAKLMGVKVSLGHTACRGLVQTGELVVLQGGMYQKVVQSCKA